MSSSADGPASNSQIPIRWFKYKKQKSDVCNLCLQKRRLSYDHVPPEGAAEIGEVEVRSLLDHLTKEQDRPTFIQNGLKYRTLCRDCNTLLGRYDRELIRFSSCIRACVKTNIIIPDRLNFVCKPNAVIRSLAGHLVAAKIQPDSVEFDQEARKLIFDDSLSIPNWNIYYWIFPFTSTSVIRDVMIFFPTLQTPYVFTHLLKYFPLAFMICDSDGFSLSRLTVAKDQDWQHETTLVLDLTQRIGEHWPEAPAEDRAIFMGDAGVRSARVAPRIRPR
jgi:hypothetical protein